MYLHTHTHRGTCENRLSQDTVFISRLTYNYIKCIIRQDS